MGISTKRGDSGKTSLCWGRRVDKDNIRIETYGTLDELCSYIGMSKSLIKDKRIKALLRGIQQDLFVIGAEIATKSRFLGRLKKRIKKSYVDHLDAAVEGLEKRRKFEECCFYLPGENFIASTLDVARTVARRVERRTVTLKKKKILKNKHILIYLNRLSDLLYLLARRFESKPQRLRTG